MSTISSQLRTIMNIISTLIIVALICSAEVTLITENIDFLMSCGKDFKLSFLTAICIAVSIITISIHYRQNVLAMVFVLCLIITQVFFSGYTAIKPQLEKTMSKNDIEIMNQYREQVQIYDNQIKNYDEQINSYSSKFKTKKKELSDQKSESIKQRKIAITELKILNEKSIEPEPKSLENLLQNTAILLTVFQRIALEFIVLFLANILTKKNTTSLELPKAHTVCKIEKQIENHVTKFAGLTPKDFVQSQFPESTCYRYGKTFKIYTDNARNVILASGGNAPKAWANAALLIEREKIAI